MFIQKWTLTIFNINKFFLRIREIMFAISYLEELKEISNHLTRVGYDKRKEDLLPVLKQVYPDLTDREINTKLLRESRAGQMELIHEKDLVLDWLIQAKNFDLETIYSFYYDCNVQRKIRDNHEN